MQQPTDFNHLSDDDLERHYLGMIADESEMAPLEEHLLACPSCVERAASTQEYVDALGAALVTIRED
ncbi:MAG TPA: hypothetical protein VF311_06020 [Terriglobales bacterium]|jgi:anti-sigma factor RsiW